MELDVLSNVLSQGSVFSIETNKTMNMAEGAPSPIMLKVSRYNVTTELAAKPEPLSWWQYTKTANVVVKKGPTPKLYLLCAMYKGRGFGSSEFFAMNEQTGEFDESHTYSKHEVEKFLPPKEPFEAEYMTLPLDSIEQLECTNPKREAEEDKAWVFPDKPCNAAPVVVQVPKPSPWAGMPARVPIKRRELPKVAAWDPSFAPAECI